MRSQIRGPENEGKVTMQFSNAKVARAQGVESDAEGA